MIEILKRIRDNLLSGDVEFALDKLDKLIETNENLEKSIIQKPYRDYCFMIDEDFDPEDDPDYPAKTSWWICNYKRYKKTGHVEDIHQSIEIPDFQQVQESLFHTEMTEDNARCVLKSLGMVDLYSLEEMKI